MNRNVNSTDAARLQGGIAVIGIVAVCALAYCAGSGWAMPGLFGIGYIVSKVRGSSSDEDDEDGFMGI